MDRQNEYQDERWKERAKQIRALDGHRCAICGDKGILHVHHLSYPPAPFHLWDSRDDELVTLCPECHKKVHESTSRIGLDEYRNVQGYVQKDEHDEEFEWDMHYAINDEEPNCAKCQLAKVLGGSSLFCINGNHEIRPHHFTCGDFRPTESARKVLKDCARCKHFKPKDNEEKYGFCDIVGDEIDRWLAFNCSDYCEPNIKVKQPTIKTSIKPSIPNICQNKYS